MQKLSPNINLGIFQAESPWLLGVSGTVVPDGGLVVEGVEVYANEEGSGAVWMRGTCGFQKIYHI